MATGDGSTTIIIFGNGSSTGTAIVYAPLDSIVSPNVAYNFTPTNNDGVPSHYTNTGTGYSYNYTPPTPTPQPDPSGFVAAMIADTTLQPILYLLAAYYAAILDYALNPSAVQLLWSQIVTQYGGTGGPLTAPMQSAILAYAVSYNCPLT